MAPALIRRLPFRRHWARAAMEKARSSGAANPRKAGVLTFDHVMGLAREISLRDGRARDPCGAALPWALMTLDRIDCSRPYEDGNVRILCDSLNRLRKNLRNDRISSSYLDRIKGCQLATVVDVEQGLPGWSKTRKWMADERGDLIGAGVDPFADEDEESLDEDDMMQVSDWEDASGDEGADAGDEDDDEDEEGEGALQRLLAEIDEDDDDDERGEEALAEAASA